MSIIMSNTTYTVVIDYIDPDGDRTLDDVTCDIRSDAVALIDRLRDDPTVKHAWCDALG